MCGSCQRKESSGMEYKVNEEFLLNESWDIVLNSSWNTKARKDYTTIVNLIFRWIDRARGYRLHRGYIKDIWGNTWFYYNKHKIKLYIYLSRMCGKSFINFYGTNYVLGKDLK